MSDPSDVLKHLGFGVMGLDSILALLLSNFLALAKLANPVLSLLVYK